MSVCEAVNYFSTDNMIVCFTPAGPSGSTQDVTVQVLSLAFGGHSMYATNVGNPNSRPYTFTYASSNTPSISASALGGYSSGGVLGFWGNLKGTSTAWYQLHVGTRDSGFRCDVSNEVQINYDRSEPYALIPNPTDPFIVDGWGNGAVRCALGPSEAGVYNMSFEVRVLGVGCRGGCRFRHSPSPPPDPRPR